MFERYAPQRYGVFFLLGFLILLTGCPKKPPTRSYQDALEALKRARQAQADKCAKEELQSAEKMMAEANKLMDEGKFEEAKVAFDAARKLADKAREESELNKEKCLKPKPDDTVKQTPPPTLITANENPTADNRQSLEPVYFGFNQYTLEGKNRDILQRHAEWIKQRPNARVQIEGHCDQRGSIDYNLALGERRAIAVKKYLEKLGVSSSQLSTISYGHQRPADPGMTPEAHNKNRRAEFKVGS